jgi:hypothetical protein
VYGWIALFIVISQTYCVEAECVLPSYNNRVLVPAAKEVAMIAVAGAIVARFGLLAAAAAAFTATSAAWFTGS